MVYLLTVIIKINQLSVHIPYMDDMGEMNLLRWFKTCVFLNDQNEITEEFLRLDLNLKIYWNCWNLF